MAVIGDMEKLTIGSKTYTIADAQARSDLEGKQETLVSGTNIRTAGGYSLLGSGDILVTLSQPLDTAWTTINSTWTPATSGIATVLMNPSNNSSAYIRIVDQTRGNYVVCQIGTTGGLAMTGTFPVHATHTYKVSSKSSNISSFQVTLYSFEFTTA